MASMLLACPGALRSPADALAARRALSRVAPCAAAGATRHRLAPKAASKRGARASIGDDQDGITCALCALAAHALRLLADAQRADATSHDCDA
jgi:hypothetical protein